MQSQKQAVIAAILSVKGEMTSNLNKSEIEQVSAIVTDGILAGTVSFSEESAAKYDTEAKVFAYTKGMVRNWLRKSPELNNGQKYQPETKRGPLKDETQKSLEALLEKHPDNAEVRAALDEHIAAKAAAKSAKTVKSINVDALPEHLRKFA